MKLDQSMVGRKFTKALYYQMARELAGIDPSIGIGGYSEDQAKRWIEIEAALWTAYKHGQEDKQQESPKLPSERIRELAIGANPPGLWEVAFMQYLDEQAGKK